MKLARYMGNGRVALVDEPSPTLPAGGLVVKTEASGLCSGELMDWYMDGKVPHVLGHEVAGQVVESEDPRFPVGCRVAPHHHAPCGTCHFCKRGEAVHCSLWKRTKLVPGGMAETFAVGPDNLSDTHRVDDMRAIDAALIEPVACVMKSIRRLERPGDRWAVIGLGVMGLVHSLLVPNVIGYDLNPSRVEWARNLGIDARHPDQFEQAEIVVVCPGTIPALKLGMNMAAPNAKIGLFAPMPPCEPTLIPLHDLYFKDISLINTYSAGPEDTTEAVQVLKEKRIQAEQIVSHFIPLSELPQAYADMKAGRILKAMVVFA